MLILSLGRRCCVISSFTLLILLVLPKDIFVTANVLVWGFFWGGGAAHCFLQNGCEENI